MRQLSYCFLMGCLAGTGYSASASADLLPLHPRPPGSVPITAQIQNLQTTITLQEQQLQQILDALVQNKLRLLQLSSEAPTPDDSPAWLTSNAALTQAFLAGTNQNHKVYICQALLYGNLYPGQLSAQGCLLTYAGNSKIVDNYSILSNITPYAWMASNQVHAKFTLQAVNGGHEYGHIIHICRVTINNRIQVGKVVSNSCNIAIGHREASWPDFDVLVTPQPAMLPLAPGPVLLPGSQLRPGSSVSH